MRDKSISIEMECFKSFRKHLAMHGIEISQKPLDNQRAFNVKNSTIFTLTHLYASLIGVLLNDSNTFGERTDIFFRIVTVVSLGMIYEIIVSKTKKLFEFIKSIDDAVLTSE